MVGRICGKEKFNNVSALLAKLKSSFLLHTVTDLLTTRGFAHLVVHGTSGSVNYEMIQPVRLETSGGELSTVDNWAWWCNDATALAGYATMMMMTVKVYSPLPVTATFSSIDSPLHHPSIPHSFTAGFNRSFPQILLTVASSFLLQD